MLAAGTYRGRPVAAKLGLTSTGKEQIAVQFAFTEPVGEKLTWYGYFTDNTFDRTIESLRSCGWTGTDLTEFSGHTLPAGFDQEVELVVQHETYENKTTARIAFINSGGGLALKSVLPEDKAKAFAARMKGRIVAADKSAGRTVGKKAPVKSAPLDTPQEMLDEQADQDVAPF